MIPNRNLNSWLFADEIMVYTKTVTGDLNYDLKVDRDDIKIMTENWLEKSTRIQNES